MIASVLARPAVVAAASAFVVMGLGGALTRLGPWYETLRKPRWQPPGWAFPTVWTTIAVLTVCSVAVAWPSVAARGATGAGIALFAINAVLNVAWSGLFFSLRRPDWALAEVVLLWLSVASLVVFFMPTPLAAVLLLPYLVWVGVAAVLNLSIARLNRPFAAARPATAGRA